MNSSFLQAAASYYGISPEQVELTDFQNHNGMVFVFQIRPTNDDFFAIVERMKAMSQMPKEEEKPPSEINRFLKETSNEVLREEYNNLAPHERSAYGSFAIYKLAMLPKWPVVTSNADDFGGLPG